MGVQAKIVWGATLVTGSPLLVGGGIGDVVDREVQRGYGGQPYIPATALAGVLRRALSDRFSQYSAMDSWWWGQAADDNEGFQSRVVLDDARPVHPEQVVVEVRTGIAIDPKSGTAIAGAKYDFEVVPAGTRFACHGEVSVYDGDPYSGEDACALVQRLEQVLHDGVQVGAKTQAGFGQVRVSDDSWRAYYFRFPQDGEAWLSYAHGSDLEAVGVPRLTERTWPMSEKSSSALEIVLHASLERALLIGAATPSLSGPDKTHIQSGGQAVIPGTAFKGVLRHQADRILKTLAPNRSEQADQAIQHLFGDAKKQRADDGPSRKSRVRIEESVVEKAQACLQTRIRLDRFTGSVIAGALFEEAPLWHQQERFCCHITVEQAQAWEVGLWLLLLKDLWTGRTTVGGGRAIGRGRLNCRTARMVWWPHPFSPDDSLSVEIESRDDGQLWCNNARAAQACVDAFWDWWVKEAEA